MLSPTELEHYLQDRIPLARAMEVVVDSVSDNEVALAAPLGPNTNHRGTLFGGSAAATAILSAWALLTVRLRDARISELVMIQQSEMRYFFPVTGHFRARSTLASPDGWERFIETLEKRQRAQITVSSILEQDGMKAVQFTGTFMAVSEGRGSRPSEAPSPVNLPKATAAAEKATSRRMDESQFIRSRLFNREKTAFQKYCELVLYQFTWWKLIRYELLATFIAPLGGAFGLVLRRQLFRGLFRSAGKGTNFGSGLTLRHADRISLGKEVMLDVDCLLDARGAGDAGIVIGDRVIVNRRASIQAKVGHIEIGRDCNIGAGVQIISQSPVVIEENVSIAGLSMVSGGRYVVEQDERRPGVKERLTRGPIHIGRNARIGMGAIIQDGVSIGENAIVAPGAVVFEDVPPDTVVWGNPARRVRQRATESASQAPAATNPAAADPTRPEIADKRQKVCEYLENDLFIEFGPDGYSTADSLVGTGAMDSLALVRLMLWIEENFSVNLDFAGLDTSEVDSVDKIVARLEARS